MFSKKCVNCGKSPSEPFNPEAIREERHIKGVMKLLKNLPEFKDKDEKELARVPTMKNKQEVIN